MPKSKKRKYSPAYQKRIDSGSARGLSKKEARGHGNLRQAKKKVRFETLDPTDPLLRGFEAVRQGAAMTPTARKLGISPERLSRFIKDNAKIERKAGRIVIVESKLIEIVTIFTKGRTRKITVTSDVRDRIAQHMTATENFLKSRDPNFLKPFVGEKVKDTRGQSYPLETNPNRLLELEVAGELDFPILYKGIVTA